MYYHCGSNYLTADERQAIIQGLKKNWEEIHEQYQGISVVTDTAPKKNRKADTIFFLTLNPCLESS
jgi:hypothetical protein